ncbi:5'-methylthioadenosine/S-adenosylhomocysteine nucleosidase-like isoform X2 [Montipora capricornis]|uniref:5'-methylthioadenosine/S-adenosylhomocysteine nucleosidase-like isoform X2 n=1 Tax=Montipora capricornis TaxID=246305 RepID=UPI0035F1A8C8
MLSANEHDPPELSITIPEKTGLSSVFKQWGDLELPIDIILLTVKDSEFLACYHFLRKPFRSYLKELGFLYFGEMGEIDGMTPLKIALVTCSEGATQPGGALIKVKNTVEMLKPKAVFCVGCCGALNPERTDPQLKLGDVVISSKLTTYANKTVTDTGVQPFGLSAPVGRDIGGLIRNAADGWKAPLKNMKARKVNVHCSGEFLSGPEEIDSHRRRQELVRLYPHAIAVEMDGEGVFIAAHDLKMEWVIIKGISDYADGTASLTQHWKPFASVMAASVVNNMLCVPVVFDDWPHYQTHEVRGGPRTPNEDPVATLLQSITGGAPGQVNFRGRTIGYRALGRFHS